MDFKTGLFLVALALGCAALPTQPKNDLSMFFEHVDQNVRIVGGDQAPVGSHPHMVAMTDGFLIRSFYCGGSLIGKRVVLTAAHCIEAVYSRGSLSSNLRLTVGTNRWNQGGQTYKVARNVTHLHYLGDDIKNDIGMFFTTVDVVESALVKIIPLSFNNVGANVRTIVAGWGRIRAGGSVSANLLELQTTTITGEKCVEDAAAMALQLNVRNPPIVEPHIEICTYHSPGKGNCNGDSGSALVRLDTNVQIGVVSWGFPCAVGAPDMYARISGFTDWFRQHLI